MFSLSFASLRKLALVLFAGGLLAACGDPNPLDIVTTYPAREGSARILIFQHTEGGFRIGSDIYIYSADGFTPDGYTWNDEGARVTYNDARYYARQFCTSMGKRLAPKTLKDGGSGYESTGMFFNCY